MSVITNDVMCFEMLVTDPFCNINLLDTSAKCQHPLQLDNKTNTCQAQCDWPWTWDRFTYPSEAAAIAVLVTSIIGIVSMIFVISTWLCSKSLLKFPHSIPLFMMLSVTSYTIVSSLPAVLGYRESFCASQYLNLYGTDQVTAFCQAQGALLHYLTISLAIWWLFYVGNMYFIVVRGNNSILNSQNTLIITQVCESFVAWGIPGILVAVVFATPTSYKHNAVFSLACFPATVNYFYYAYSLPCQICLLVGQVMLCEIVRFLYELRRYTKKTNVSRPSGEEDTLKLIQYRFVALAFCYLIIVTTFMVMTTITIQTADDYVKMVKIYFQCLRLTTREQCRDFLPISRFSQRSLGILIGISSGALCLTNLIFLIPSKETRKVWRRWFRRITCSSHAQVEPRERSAYQNPLLIYDSKVV
ncbi:uncharacterized protein TRIADDRAFT_51875 [Trichoplax adhaerens]|uniref:G-protein coupled receptors family 2 profile 2 domain-containing protein n=1 Tax=Trichoplax adhaerens TaxID=10228 RepID=B3RL47_TRIAD|nr:predicted protein [Trichoplax adhaerens]EDV28698.1 predicted protein [Trichoplax adhaerens]|eukprot:XP_002107900.1 predicted protein [Trichoplax adhaerens]